jgi:hypothetical protein
VKRVAYIFILLFCFWFKLFSAQTVNVFALKQLSDLNKYESSSKEIFQISIINTKDYPFSNKILSEKKIRQRGLASVFYLFTNKCPLLVGFSNKKLIHSSQLFYSLRLFSGNEKRGPPAVLAS